MKKQMQWKEQKTKRMLHLNLLPNWDLPYYCFHDVDVVDYTNDIYDNEKRLQALTAYLKEKQAASGVKLLWGTANLFSNRSYMNGASTNPDFHVLAHGGCTGESSIGCNYCIGW